MRIALALGFLMKLIRRLPGQPVLKGRRLDFLLEDEIEPYHHTEADALLVDAAEITASSGDNNQRFPFT